MAPQAVDSQLRRRPWIRLFPGVYGTGVDPDDPRTRIRAAWLWALPDGVIIGRSSGYWWDQHPAPVLVEVGVPRVRRLSAQPGIRVVRSDIPDCELRTRDGITVISLERTLLDLARSGDPDRAENALRLGLTSQDRLVASVAKSRYRRGQLAARRLVDELTDGPWSPPERWMHVALRTAKITGWKANVRVVIHGEVLFLDVAFEELKLVIEIDGRDHHTAAEMFESDRERQNLLTMAGWTVLRFTWRQIRYDAERVIATVLATLVRLKAGVNR